MDLSRFKEKKKTYFDIALKEIKTGRKESHWMWFIFPQLKGLGMSYYAEYYGIDNLEEAKAYLKNEYLCNNLISICDALLSLNDNNIIIILGYPDNLKLRSSMTLFLIASEYKQTIFKNVLDKYYNGELDNSTIKLIYRNK